MERWRAATAGAARHPGSKPGAALRTALPPTPTLPQPHPISHLAAGAQAALGAVQGVEELGLDVRRARPRLRTIHRIAPVIAAAINCIFIFFFRQQARIETRLDGLSIHVETFKDDVLSSIASSVASVGSGWEIARTAFAR